MTPLLAAALLLMTIASAGAQNAAEPTPVTPGFPPAKAPAAQQQLNSVDRAFLRDAALGGRAEVELGRLASGKAQSPDVKAFADRMQQDHREANAELAEIAKKHEVALPGGLDPERRDAMKRLQAGSGADFDLAYIGNQVQEHQRAVQLFAHEIGSGQNADLRAAAIEKLPSLMTHLDLARQLNRELAGAR